ncbi:MAG: hypothetical protein AAF639_13850 [Chloroflexota bacterium]
MNQIAEIQFEPETPDCAWQQYEHVQLSDTQQVVLDYIVGGVAKGRTSIMNEATLWARLNYPLLQLAETEQLQAWSEVSTSADLPYVTLHGVIDGVLGYTLASQLHTPWLVIVEAKKGLENKDPRYQLYGQILATIFLNHQAKRTSADVEITVDESVLYGGYTVVDNWTFIRAKVTNLETNRPKMRLAFSREYAGRLEAETILKILTIITHKAT